MSLGVGKGIAYRNFDIERLSSSANHFDDLWMTVCVNKKGLGGNLRLPTRQHHGFGRCCCLVEHRGVRNLHSRQVRHYCLKVQKCFEPTL